LPQCTLCHKKIWPWQDWFYIQSPIRPYHYECGYKLDYDEQPRSKESFATEAYYNELLMHSDFQCVKCGFLSHGVVPTKHKTPAGKKCDGAFRCVLSVENKGIGGK
jgi:hypothetical protein